MLAVKLHQLFLLSLLSLLPFQTLASPAPLDLQGRDLPCDKNPIVLILRNTKIAPSGTKFCSSFLSIQTKTIEVTPTVYTSPPEVTITKTITELQTTTAADAERVTKNVATNVITNTKLLTATVTRVETAYVTTTVAGVITDRQDDPNPRRRRGSNYARSGLVEKRIIKSVDIPGYLKAFASKAISSACNCLSIPTPITTVTKAAVTVTTGEPATETQTQHVTDIEVVKTITIDVTTTVYATVDYVDATATLKQQTTVASTYIVGPTQCAPENLNGGQVSYRPASILAAAGLVTTDTLDSSINSKRKCCESCWSRGDCFGFAYGNYDPGAYPEQAPTQNNRCFLYRTVRGCSPEYAAWWVPPGGTPAGGITGFGYGPCPLRLDS